MTWIVVGCLWRVGNRVGTGVWPYGGGAAVLGVSIGRPAGRPYAGYLEKLMHPLFLVVKDWLLLKWGIMV